MSRRRRRQLHPAAVAILNFVVQFKRENDGCAPSLRELVENVEGVASTSMAQLYLDELEAAGLICRIRLPDGTAAARGILVLGGSWSYSVPIGLVRVL